MEAQKPKLNIYICGPTVYDHAHIGNMRGVIYADYLVRNFRAMGYDVTAIMNITDIDDKIINAAKARKRTPLEISTEYTDHFFKVIEQYGVLQFNAYPKVTEIIPEILKYIEKLEELNLTYVLKDGIYFKTKEIPSYGNVSKQDISSLQPDENEVKDKLSPSDFVLWKFEESPFAWDSKWGKGRPGWHTECAAIIQQVFGDRLNIHIGGNDLKFPHHENEDAQHRAIFNKPICESWLHVGQVMLNGAKMSKSSGNVELAKDVIKKHNINILRWWVLRENITKPLDFSQENLEQAKRELLKVEGAINRANVYVMDQKPPETYSKLSIQPEAVFQPSKLIELLFKFTNDIDKTIREDNYQEVSNNLLNSIGLLNSLGIVYTTDTDPKKVDLITEWKKLVNEKYYKKADKLRDKIMRKKILDFGIE